VRPSDDLEPCVHNLSTLVPLAVCLAPASHGWPFVWTDRVALHPALCFLSDKTQRLERDQD